MRWHDPLMTSVEGLADDGLARLVAAMRADEGPTFRERGAAAVRAGAAARPRVAEPAMAEVRDLVVEGVGARLYRPVAGVTRLLVFLHGGMWSIGSLDTHERACRELASTAGVSVLAVDYRLAPEHPFPAAVEDAVAVTRWALARVGELGCAGVPGVGGDSAGGHLAAMVCLRLRDGGEAMPSVQVLVTPNTDLTLSRPSTREKAVGWGLTTDAVAWGAEQWVPDPARRGDPDVSPLAVRDLSGLPPAVVVSAEHDPLRDEGEEYAERLRAAGVEVESRREVGMIHGFLTLHGVSAAVDAASRRVARDVARALPAR
ncbi:alpha/beta hydrolase [Phytomonospora sp. NPDC050363]|uniref:alpha/beta hydrolase n=1 Tax=Phytomonospora sp. NPDC050363 TaxID=3155642 RepID=UPI00340E1236